MSTGNTGLDALADAIAERVIARMKAEGTDQPALLTVRQAAKYLSRSTSAVRVMIAKGGPPSCAGGGRVIRRREDLEQAIPQATARR